MCFLETVILISYEVYISGDVRRHYDYNEQTPYKNLVNQNTDTKHTQIMYPTINRAIVAALTPQNNRARPSFPPAITAGEERVNARYW